VTGAPVQLRWHRGRQHAAFLEGLRLLNHAPELTMDVLLSLHTILLPPSHPDRGRFRDGPIKVRFNGVARWKPPPASEALGLTERTAGWVNAAVGQGLDPETAKANAARALFEITDVHPFRDGNGRVARSIAGWLLIRGGYALLMDPGVYCHDRRDDYYRALDSNNLDPAVWRGFFDELVGYCFRRVEAT
jgi:Fic family protein